MTDFASFSIAQGHPHAGRHGTGTSETAVAVHEHPLPAFVAFDNILHKLNGLRQVLRNATITEGKTQHRKPMLRRGHDQVGNLQTFQFVVGQKRVPRS